MTSERRPYATATRSDACPHGCGYSYPIPACVRLHLIQHHDYGYDEAQAAYPDEPIGSGSSTRTQSVTE